MSPEGAELLKAVEQMKAGKKGRVYTPEQLSACSSVTGSAIHAPPCSTRSR